MPNTPKGYSTLSNHLHFHPKENLSHKDKDRVKGVKRHKRRMEVKRRVFGNLKRGFRSLLRDLGGVA
jgi:hypothetical protein